MCHSSMTITSSCSIIMHSSMLQRSIPSSWKMKTSPEHVNHFEHIWNALNYTSTGFSSCQCTATLHSHQRGVDHHSTGHKQQSDQLYYSSTDLNSIENLLDVQYMREINLLLLSCCFYLLLSCYLLATNLTFYHK